MRDLSPSYFSLVMATGIVSIAADLQGWAIFADVLMWITVATYVILAVLNVWRWARFRAAMAADLRSPSRSFGFFTFVAGTSVVGTRLALEEHTASAVALLIGAAVAGLVLGYVIPAYCLSATGSGPVTRHADGTWFVWAVAVQSVAVLAATLQPQIGRGSEILALMAVSAWGIGVFLYVMIGLIVAARLVSYRLEPADLTAPYWVGMGATAITVVAGSTIMALADAPALDPSRHLIGGVTMVFWAFGTWLIPPLLVAGYWRHVKHRIPLRYDVALWSIVFPLGMYGVGSHDLGRQADLDILRLIGHVEAWIAVVAWTLTFAAMLLSPSWRPTPRATRGTVWRPS